MTFEDYQQHLVMQKYWICCPMCDNQECIRGSDKCEAEIWQREKEREFLKEVTE